MTIDEQHSKAIKTENKALILYKKAKLHRLKIERHRLLNPDSKESVNSVVRNVRNR